MLRPESARHREQHRGCSEEEASPEEASPEEASPEEASPKEADSLKKNAPSD